MCGNLNGTWFNVIFVFQKFEDTDLDLKPLPTPKLVSTPDGLPNDTFGDVAMVTEFIACYSGLLMPDNQYPIQTGMWTNASLVLFSKYYSDYLFCPHDTKA